MMGMHAAYFLKKYDRPVSPVSIYLKRKWHEVQQ